MKKTISTLSVLVLLCLLFSSSLVSQNCPNWAMSTQKDNHLFLYMPQFSDSIFPEFGYAPYGIYTSPLAPFDVADLDPGIGTSAQLMQRIYEMVTDDYCEFNVEVHTPYTLGMSPAASNWQVVGVGTDYETYSVGSSNYVLFGIATNVDYNDSNPQDHARVWSDSFMAAYPTTFSGVNSTLERWANAIAHTVSHEAGHNYGLRHEDAEPRPGSIEDGTNWHIMATGSTGLTGEMRASRDRHFSDTSYEILGHNLGLNTNTIHNWDFTNPNNTNACSLKFKILSPATTLSTTWFYTGYMSPWINPVVTPTGTTEVFHGTTYNVFYVTLSVPQSWSNGPNGQVPPGEKFHVGVSFTQNTGIIVKETILLNCSGIQMPLQPRIFAYDSGFMDFATGNFNLNLFNPDPDRPLIVQNLTVQRVPRMIDINTMMTDREPLGLDGAPINTISSFTLQEDIELFKQKSVLLANLSDKRHIDITYSSKDCEKGVIATKGIVTPDSKAKYLEGDFEYCSDGTALSLFPSTYVYIIADVIDPKGCYWSPTEERFVTGPIKSKVFYQVSGFVPDFNENGIDDLLDIRNGTSVDENKNGVPDEVEEKLQKIDSSQIDIRKRIK